MQPLPTLQTSRLVLQPLQLSDAPAIQRRFAHWQVVRYLNAVVPWPYPDDGALSYVRDVALPAMARSEEWHWTIRLLAEPDELIGSISLMDAEIDTHHAEAHAPVAAIARLAGALPAFGIVAAVLGVVNTMGSVGQPPSVLGGMIASALVGTFLGILLAYGFVEPLGGLLEQKTEDAAKEFQCIKSTLLASMQGYNPATAIEFGRKVLFSTDRPTFSELEGHVKGKK